MNKVFVIQKPTPNRHGWVPNLTPALKYGSVEFVFNAEQKPSLTPGASMNIARAALQGFDAEKDFILWPQTGDPIGYAIVMMVLMERQPKAIRFLQWDRSPSRDGTGEYLPLKIERDVRAMNY